MLRTYGKLKRLLAMLLSMLMLITVLPVSAFAENDDPSDNVNVETTPSVSEGNETPTEPDAGSPAPEPSVENNGQGEPKDVTDPSAGTPAEPPAAPDDPSEPELPAAPDDPSESEPPTTPDDPSESEPPAAPETPAEPTNTPDPTDGQEPLRNTRSAPTPVPKPDFIFPQAQVKLAYILDTLEIDVGNNYELELSVDSSVVRLSHTVLKNKNRDQVTLTASRHFDFAILTLQKNKDIITITIGWPEPEPTAVPDATPTVNPDATPTVNPDATPTVNPDATPTVNPDATPTVNPDATPTVNPDATPTVNPDATPTVNPDATPTVNPDATPTVTPELSEEPTATPGATPTATPEATPTASPEATPAEDDPQEVDGMVIDPFDYMELSGRLPKHAQVDVKPVQVEIDGEQVLAAFDIKIYINEAQKQAGKTWQPADGKVTVRWKDEAFASHTLNIYHVADGAAPAYVTTVQAKDGWVEFEADSFSVYAVTETTLTKTVTTSDGATYEIQVTYTDRAGIPMEGTALRVDEIREDDKNYTSYIEESARKMGTKVEHLAFARAFDIKIVDAGDDSRVYEPQAQVQVAITLLGVDLSTYAKVDVLHFGGDPFAKSASVDAMKNDVDGETVRFATNSFSVYVVAGEVHLRTYRFYTLNEYGDYTEYAFTDENGATVFAQTIKNGETPIIPNDPINPQDPTASFAGWFEDVSTGTDLELAPTAYDFSHIPEITQDEEVKLYAQFFSYVYLIFHDQYDSATSSYPVAFTERAALSNGSATFDISGKRVVYADTSMVFCGWSRTPIRTPGATHDDEGHPVHKEDGDTLTITETTHLYPIFKSVYWLSFVSGPTGSGATYYPETYYYDGVGPTSLADRVPTRDGNYTFEGWYVGSTILNGETDKGEVDPDHPGTKIANADGTLIANASADGISVTDGKIVLTGDVTLYAVWTKSNTANYTVVIVKQKASDEAGIADSAKTYEFSESFLLSGTIDNTVTAETDYTSLNNDESYNALHDNASVSGESNPYYGYQYNATNSVASVVVAANGSAVMYIRYDWTSKPDMNGKTFTLTFADSVETYGEASPDLPVAHDQLAYGAALSGYVPSDPDSGREGYSFTGWFADKACTTRVVFHAAPLTDAETSAFGTKPHVFFDTMPGTDLTVYAGWEKEWYIVTIDPNYGELDSTASTWFWSAYGSQIQEYTATKREYVESDSGTWYYVYHDQTGYDEHRWTDRRAYYTQVPAEATEFTTFELKPGIYRYDGWYEVMPDGTEVRYDFNRIVDDYITLRLHWTKMGAFYLNYVAGEGVLHSGEELEELYVELEGNSYADNAQVVVNRTADAPDGFEFVGWKIRGDDSETVYYPGQAFTLLTKYAATVQGRKTVYLDAVYKQIPTASIVYDANGGVLDADDLDYGHPEDTNASFTVSHDTSTATISNLINNSKVYLSDGSGFSRTNASLAGWCANPIYDPYDSSAPLLTPGVAYGVDVNEPTILYAIWQVDVIYHLNKSTTEADFGGDWGTEYTLSGDTYTQNVCLESLIYWPPHDPVYTGAGQQMFRYWATRTETAGYYTYPKYDFSQPIQDALDLYAVWGAPLTVPIKALDASQDTILDKSTNWSASQTISIGADPVALDATAASAAVQNVPPGYVFAFATSGTDINSITEKRIQSLSYSSEYGQIVATYDDGNGETLSAGEEVYFVYYQEKALSISYMTMAANGDLTTRSVSGQGTPSATATALGECVVGDLVTAPRADASWHGYYAYAIGPAVATNISQLPLITEASNNDSSRPALKVRNSWRGFEYSTDGGASWVNCGYDIQLYVVYYDKQPTVVTFRESTVGFAADMETSFTFNYLIEESDGTSVYNSVVKHEPVLLRDGEAYSAILFTDGSNKQRITITQTVNTDFTTKVGDAGTLVYTYEADPSEPTHLVTFTNTRKPSTVEVHVARVSVTDGTIHNQDSWRDSTTSFMLAPGESKNFVTDLPVSTLASNADEDYAFGAVFYGTEDSNGVITPMGPLNVASIAYEPIEEGSNVYTINLRNADGFLMSELGSYNIYYLYYPKLTVHYLKEGDNGDLTPIVGSTSGNITYGGYTLTMNGLTVVQDQKVELPQDGLVISQGVGAGNFNMPPLLDDGVNPHELLYYKLGAKAQSDSSTPITNISALNGFVSEDLTLHMSIVNNVLSWSFDEQSWTSIGDWPVVYAIYRERGHDLIVTKTVPIDTGYKEPFTITVSSTAINRTSYAVEGVGSSTIEATPAVGSTPGSITFTVTDGSSVKIIGLGAGSYTVTETDNENYTLTAKIGNVDQTVTNDAVTLALSAETELELINTSQPICQVGHRQFYTISSAVEWIENNAADSSGTIEMLMDYLMPSSDATEIPEYLTITLTSATGGGYTITRKDTFTSGAMFTNSGTFTLQGITVDGNHVNATGAMIQNDGTLTVADGATLQNADHSGNGGEGGAIRSWNGSVTVEDGATITNCNAVYGGAIFASNGTVTVSGGTISGNSATNGGAVYYTGSDSVTVSGGDVSGNSATNGGAIYLEKGTLKVSGGSMGSNTATENGGAAYALNGAIEISGGTIGGETTANSAANGGAIYLESGSVTVSESAAISHNEASENGGGICTGTGTVTVSGGSLASNAATGNGGGVYTASGAITVSGNSTTINSNSAANGGGLYSGSGAVSVTGAALSSNSATSGNGGGVYADTGSVSLSSATFTGNSAGNGYGGGLYAGSGAATLSSCTFGGADGSGNSAINGAAVYTNTGSATFSAGTVSYNTATNGGAVGVGSSSARLYFSGNVKVTGNTMNGSDSNVYLDQDSDAVINATGLGGGAAIGVYVPDQNVTVDGAVVNLFDRRGVPSAFFGSYSNNSNVGRFSNDRLPGLSVQMETSSKRLYWGKAFTVEARYLASFSSSFPTVADGDLKKIDNSESIRYYAPSSTNAASGIADNLRSAHSIDRLSGTAVFGAAFVGGDRSFAGYITDVNWDSADNRWNFVRRDGTTITGDKLVVYFTEPSYIQIENNTPYPLSISNLTVLGQPAINSSLSAGYGYVFAVNGVIQNQLRPITEADLALQPGKSVKLLFPGGKNAAWTLSGKYTFTNDPEDIPYTLNGTANTLAADNAGNFSLNGTTLNSNGGTYPIVFGGKSAICRIVTAEIPGVESSEIAGKTEPDAQGKVEYTFSTLNQAVTFAQTHSLTEAAIEMLVDYLIPGSDVIISLPTTCNFTFSTAIGGTYKYSDDPSARATISRDQGNNSSFITSTNGVLENGDYKTTLTVKNLIFDGKNIGGSNISGGIVKTKGWNVVVDHVEFRNSKAQFGGGIYIESVDKNSSDKTPIGRLTVSNSSFTNCECTAATDKFGGGAIWTSMKTVTIEHTDFLSCKANQQGGALFHYVAADGSRESYTMVDGCTFDGCSTGSAAGSMESGATVVTVKNTTFRNSTSNAKNGGALNVWSGNSDNTKGNPTTNCYVTLDNCIFEHCYANNGSGTNGNGGAMRSTATYNTITNCTFIDARGNNGGAINIFNEKAVTTTISDCTFRECDARNIGGAIFCASKELIIDGTSNSILNCTAQNAGGGIYHGKDANGTKLSITKAVVDNCSSNTAAGGGIYTMAQTVTANGLTVTNCSSQAQGGGVYLYPKSSSDPRSVTITDSTIQNNGAIGNGGGLYYDCGSGTLAFTGCSILQNTSTSMGGGIYTNAANVTLTETTVKDNTATGNGGGVCQNANNASGRLTVDSCTITGNTSGGKGGGVYTEANLALQGVEVTGNTLSTDDAQNAAGIYMPNGRTLTVGLVSPTSGYDTITVTGNTTAHGAASDLRLPESNGKNSDSVNVLCDLKGEIRVVNAKVKGTQFGHTNIAYVGGFSDLEHVFIADDDTLYGTIDRADATHKKIIWGTEPICKITDDRGRLLYLKIEGSAFPAVFDYLDRDNGSRINEVSAFGILRGHDAATNNVKLYNADGTPYAGNICQVKMLVEQYTEDSAIATPSLDKQIKTVILTTAGSNDSLYPYRGRAGTRSTVLRGAHDKPMITAKCNLTLQNIVMDSGSENGAAAGASSRILVAETPNTTVRLGKNSALQNAAVTGDTYGAGVRLNGASLILEGGSIRNCSTQTSGGGIQVKNGNLTITGGTITRCSAVENGGGVFFENGTFTMSGGSITRNTAATGAGVYVAAGKAMTMSGGSISSNTATTSGGGIAVGSGASRLYFSGAPYVYGNTLNGAACNVQMNQHFVYGAIGDQHESESTVIVSNGLIRGATIGVYVPDGPNLYNEHGVIQTPFGTYVPGSNTNTLNYFINDRNQLKGGLYETQAADNYMIYWVKIYSLQVSKLVMSDDPRDEEKEFHFKVQLTGEVAQVLARDVNTTYGEMTFVGGIAQFTLKNGQTITAEKMPLGYGYTVTEELSAQEQQYYITTPSLSQSGEMDVETRYLYEVSFNNLHAICKITDANEGMLYYNKDGVLRPALYSKLQNAFNALRGETFYNESGVVVQVNTEKTHVEMLVDYTMDEEQGATFQLGTKAILTTADRNATDGYPYVGSGSTATITRGYDGGSMITVNGDLTLGNITLDGGSDSGKQANTNGGVFNVASGGKLTVGTGTTIQNSTTSGNGAGVFLAEGSVMNISGGPVFSNNVSTVALAQGSTNGDDDYTQACQDIYIAGYSFADAASLAVTGNITSSQGSIWVWAEQSRHYEQSKQFAVMSGGTGYTGLNAFRNAQTDTQTKNPLKSDPKYLYGVKRGTDGKVYWSGSAFLTIRKLVTGDMADPNRTFTFTVTAPGLTAGETCEYVRYTTTNGSTWTQATTGTLSVGSNGVFETFTLKHYEGIEISLPGGTTVTVTETSVPGVTASYTIGTGASTQGFVTSQIAMDQDRTVTFTNEMHAVGPTGVSFQTLPFALMLMIGLALPVILPRRRRKKED